MTEALKKIKYKKAKTANVHVELLAYNCLGNADSKALHVTTREAQIRKLELYREMAAESLQNMKSEEIVTTIWDNGF